MHHVRCGVGVFALIFVLGACSADTSEGASQPEEVAVEAQALTASPDALCVSGSNAGHAYWFCPTLRTWQDARTKCQNIGFDLASIETCTC